MDSKYPQTESATKKGKKKEKHEKETMLEFIYFLNLKFIVIFS